MSNIAHFFTLRFFPFYVIRQAVFSHTCSIACLKTSIIHNEYLFSCTISFVDHLDKDECKIEKPCDVNAVYYNTDGLFACSCNVGYSVRELTCVAMQMFSHCHTIQPIALNPGEILHLRFHISLLSLFS